MNVTVWETGSLAIQLSSSSQEYLESREKEVVSIMISLFDEEQIMDVFVKDRVREAKKERDFETAERMIKMGDFTLEQIAKCIPGLTMEELEELETEVSKIAL
jgi:hypothetical protein